MGIEELRACEYWTAREGRAAVGLWRKSGLPLRTWARAVDLRASRVAYWHKRLGAPRRRPSTPESATSATALALTLAPVAVLGTERPRGRLTLELRSGRAIRIEGELDEATLARVIAIAEHAPC